MMQSAQAQPPTVDPETIVPLPSQFDMEPPASDVPPEIARFEGAWIGTWQDDRHILVVERVRADGHADLVFARSDSAFNGMNREWWRDRATVVDGVPTMTGFPAMAICCGSIPSAGARSPTSSLLHSGDSGTRP